MRRWVLDRLEALRVWREMVRIDPVSFELGGTLYWCERSGAQARRESELRFCYHRSQQRLTIAYCIFWCTPVRVYAVRGRVPKYVECVRAGVDRRVSHHFRIRTAFFLRRRCQLCAAELPASARGGSAGLKPSVHIGSGRYLDRALVLYAATVGASFQLSNCGIKTSHGQCGGLLRVAPPPSPAVVPRHCHVGSAFSGSFRRVRLSDRLIVGFGSIIGMRTGTDLDAPTIAHVNVERVEAIGQLLTRGQVEEDRASSSSSKSGLGRSVPDSASPSKIEQHYQGFDSIGGLDPSINVIASS